MIRSNHKFFNLTSKTDVFINTLISKFNLESVNFIDERFNAVFSAVHPKYGRVIIRIGSHSYRKTFEKVIFPESCGYFDLYKYDREKDLISIAKQAGLPTPTIIGKGHFVDHTPWCIETEVAGNSLEKMLTNFRQGEKLKLFNEIGQLLAKFHSQKSSYNKTAIKLLWDRKISILNKNLVSLNVYTTQDIRQIMLSLEKLKTIMLANNHGLIGPVHLEIIPKHIFVDINLSVSSIIDWETGELEGDTFCDITSTAYWLSGKGEYSDGKLTLTNLDEFQSVLDGYSSKISINRTAMLDSLPFYDLMWLLNILWVKTFQGKSTFIDTRKKIVEQIVDFAIKYNPSP